MLDYFPGILLSQVVEKEKPETDGNEKWSFPGVRTSSKK